MVVQISGLNQLSGPTVEIVQPGLRRFGGMNRLAQPRITLQRGQVLPQPRGIVVPHLGPLFQPPLKITAPNHLINELCRGFSALRFYGRGDDLGLSYEPASDIG